MRKQDEDQPRFSRLLLLLIIPAILIGAIQGVWFAIKEEVKLRWTNSRTGVPGGQRI